MLPPDMTRVGARHDPARRAPSVIIHAAAAAAVHQCEPPAHLPRQQIAVHLGSQVRLPWCHEDGESMWVRSCRGTFRCGDGPEVPCGFPPGQPSYRRRRCIKPTEPKAKGDRSFAELTSAALKRQGKVTGLINNLLAVGANLCSHVREPSRPPCRALCQHRVPSKYGIR